MALLKTATDSRESRDFVRASTMVNGTVVTIVATVESESGVNYLQVVHEGMSGFVKAEYVKVKDAEAEGEEEADGEQIEEGL